MNHGYLLRMVRGSGTPVAHVPLKLTPTAITGTITEGQQLTGVHGTYLYEAPTGYTYKWYRNGVAIGSATSITYVLQAADIAANITFGEIASNATGPGLENVSDPVGPIAAAPVLKPVNTIAPVVSGTTQSGQALSCTTGTWSNVPTGYAYQWKADGSDIGGATSSIYVLADAQVAANITCAVTASNAAGNSLSAALSNSVGPVTSAPVGDPYAGVATASMAYRQTVVDKFTGIWDGHGVETFTTDVTATSPADIITKFNAISRVDRTKWHRIKLDSTLPAATWATTGIDFDGQAYAGTIGALFGGAADWATLGGGVVIESSDPNNMVTLYGTAAASMIDIRGVRGLHLRNFNIGNSAPGITSTNRDAAVCLSIIGNSTRPDAPAVVLENIGFGLAFHPTETDLRKSPVAVATTGTTYPTDILSIKNCRFNGVQTGLKTSGVKYLKTFGSDFQKMVGDCLIPLCTATLSNINSAYDGRVFHWSRLNTERNVADDPAFSDEHKDFNQHGTSGDVGGYLYLSEFNAMHGKRLTGTDKVVLTFSAQPVTGSSVTIGGTAFAFVTSGATGTQVNIGATLSITLDNLLTVFTANLPAACDRGIKTSTTFTAHFLFTHYVAPTRTTSPASNASVGSPTRTAGSTQCNYADDSPATQVNEGITINDIATSSDGICTRFYNGTSIMDRCIGGRPGDLPLAATVGTDGYNSTADYQAYITSARKTTAVTINHTLRSSVFGNCVDRVTSGEVGGGTRTTDGSYTTVNSTLTMTNNRFVSWVAAASGNKPGDLMAGTFGTDAQGRVRYDFTDDNSLTQQQFRQALYDQFKLGNTSDRATIGTTNPNIWPAA